MPNDAIQNPANRWARNSGAGAAGISAVVPTEAEARRGLQPFTMDGGAPAGRAIALGLVAAVGALVAGLVVWRARQPEDVPTRIKRRVGLR